MGQNPLQQYFRQPKVYVGLPSMGVYNKPGTIQGDASNMPIYGMTGMDEILMKTPDALMAGETTVKIIESCCPSIKDGWDVSGLDIDLLLVAIRIATYGNTLEITHVCDQCKADNEYSVELSPLIDYFSTFQYKNIIALKDLTIKLQPLTYKQTTAYSLRNFTIQQQLNQASRIENKDEQSSTIAALFLDLSKLQNEIFTDSIESVQLTSSVVTEKAYIKEWLENCDSSFFDDIKNQINQVRNSLQMPPFDVKCEHCGHETKISIDLDQSSFFAKA